MQNGDYKIETGIPIPAHHGASKYPFKDLKVGESVFIPNKQIGQLSGCLDYARNRHKIKLSGRTVEGGVRIWRTA